MPMSECTNSEVRDLLPLLASGGHVPSSADVEAHVAACESCRDELELLRTARRALLRAPTMDAARIARAVPAYARTEQADAAVIPIDSRRRKAPAWRIAAAALIVVASGTALAVRQAGDERSIVAAIDSPASAVPTAAGAAGQPSASAAAGIAAPGGVAPTTRTTADTSTEMTFGGGLADLSEEELVALLAALDDEDVLTPEEPDEVVPSLSIDGEEES